MMTVSLIALMGSSLTQRVASSLINAITGKWVRRARKGQESGIFPLLVLTLMVKFLGKGATRTKKGVKGTGK